MGKNKFKVQEIRLLLGQLKNEEITLSRFTEIIDERIISHSPNISNVNDPANDDSMLIEFQHLEPDTLQEGDWFQSTEEQYRKVLEMEGSLKEDAYDDFIEDCVNHGMVWQKELGNGFLDNLTCYFKTQLTPEEFLRRAENTFKKKKDMERDKTENGLIIYNFIDKNQNECNIQESSIAYPPCLWMGIDGSRMHLTQDIVKKTLPILQKFSETGIL